MSITIYDLASESPSYDFELNYPFTIRLAKEGIYVLHGSTSHLIMERNYDLEAIYFNEDGSDNIPINTYENGDYDIAFDLVVSEHSGQIEDPKPEKTNSLKIGDTVINNIYMGDSQVLKICLGDTVIYEASFILGRSKIGTVKLK